MKLIATSLDPDSISYILESGSLKDVTFASIEEILDNQFLLQECIGIWTTLFPRIDLSLVEKFVNLEFIASSTTGLTHIDMHSISKIENLKIFSLKTEKEFISKISATPEFAWGLALDVWRKITLSNNEYVSDTEIRKNYSSNQLAGKNLGLIGFGRVGKYLSQYAKAFQMNVKYYDPYLSANIINTELNVQRFQNLEKMIEVSDIVIVCASVLDDSFQLINSQNIKYFKKNSILINIARGSLVDEHAVAFAILNGRLAGAGFDVLVREEINTFSNDPSPLEILKKQGFNVVITPHIAGMCIDAFQKCNLNIANQINRYFQSK
ncbi:MAG: hypothetical protein RLZZ44_245 [Bacteroidota bacterium]|jgi:D-3-phosphoglycerate dehydrogenase